METIVPSHSVDLTPAQAAALIDDELAGADGALETGRREDAFDGYVRALSLALALPPDRRKEMTDNARAHATLLDDATGALFHLTNWVDELYPSI